MPNLFDAPIPGQSLTQQKGSAPWEYPPKFVDLNEALEYTFELLSTPKAAAKLHVQLKKGMPAEYLANTILFTGAAQSLWTLDVALLMKKTLVQQIVAIGKLTKVKNIKIKTPNSTDTDFFKGFLDLIEPKKEEPAPMGKPEFSGIFGAL